MISTLDRSAHWWSTWNGKYLSSWNWEAGLSEMDWAGPFPFCLFMPVPSDLLEQTAQESLLPSDMGQNLHESLLWLLKPLFMDSWSLLIILEINAGFWTGTWNENHSWHQYHRHWYHQVWYPLTAETRKPLPVRECESWQRAWKRRDDRNYCSALIGTRDQNLPQVSVKTGLFFSMDTFFPYGHGNLLSISCWGDNSHAILFVSTPLATSACICSEFRIL